MVCASYNCSGVVVVGCDRHQQNPTAINRTKRTERALGTLEDFNLDQLAQALAKAKADYPEIFPEIRQENSDRISQLEEQVSYLLEEVERLKQRI